MLADQVIANAWATPKSAVAQVVIYVLYVLWLGWLISCYRATRAELSLEKYLESRRRQM